MLDIAEPKQGLATADNNRFLRLWFEVSSEKTYFTATDSIQAFYTGAKWFPYNKGGEYRKWYGNNDYVVNWEKDGFEIKNILGKNGKIASRAQNIKFYFREAITWSKVSTGGIAFRYKPKGHIFDVAGTSVFDDDSEELMYLLGLNNSNTINHILQATSPTINYEVGQISNIPVKKNDNREILNIVRENVDVSKKEWDEFEVSWDFKKHPLI